MVLKQIKPYSYQPAEGLIQHSARHLMCIKLIKLGRNTCYGAPKGEQILVTFHLDLRP